MQPGSLVLADVRTHVPVPIDYRSEGDDVVLNIHTDHPVQITRPQAATLGVVLIALGKTSSKEVVEALYQQGVYVWGGRYNARSGRTIQRSCACDPQQ